MSEKNFMSFLNSYTDLLGTFEGTSELEIIESEFNIRLPDAYKQFLAKFGKNCGQLLKSYYMEFPYLKENRIDAIAAINFDDRISDINKPIIKANYFFFGQWQGYIFYFFECNEGIENPEVLILRDSIKIEKFKNTFTDFLFDEGIKPLIELKKKQ